MRKGIKQSFSTFFIKTARNDDSEFFDEFSEEVELEKPENLNLTFVRMSLLRYDNAEMPVEYATGIIDLLNAYTQASRLSVIYFSCDPQHGELITQLIKENPDYIQGNVEIKIVTPTGLKKIHPSI